MRIRFSNGLVLGGGDYQVQTIEGLEAPEIRTGSGVYAGADGGFVVSQLYGLRTIIIKGFFLGNCAEQTNTLRQELIRKLYMRYYSALTIEDFAEQCWITNGYVSDIKCSITSPYVGEYQLTVLCPDPLLYPCDSFLSSEPVKKQVGLTVNGETSILYEGDSDVFPIIKLTGEFTNPIVSLGDSSFGLNLTTDSSSEIVIDSKARTVLSGDGTSLADYRLVDSRWLHLASGVNTVVITTESPSDTGTGEMVYSAGYRGI